ncbi:DsbA family protein [Tenacibaculum tangerinum]|uniref:DsbA family protein n=1 Tax=Tenacibaculum tangerinum TaxID=3038772 RepID=A0ABY8L1A0_9FLAO|nr:DsbA family protein [Tenacibaculum tangerinum]WGH75130.1 DsbA family protein [Tenacibaculum tangerinum]
MKNLFTYELELPVNDQDQIAGPENAKITIVEYGDYECPHCKMAMPIVKRIKEDYGDDLRLVFRNFPLTQIHKFANDAARAAELAGEYDKFWEMHELIFRNQDQLDIDHLIDYAKQLGIDSDEFSARLEQNEKVEKVKSDFMSGVESGVNGTPSFFVNGKKYEGSWEYEDFSKILKEL